ncbi:hypothetical protein C5167_030929 [Papaver somniferum]|nr:hypothetical protein C5167_030929 [Papaver somniferum]
MKRKGVDEFSFCVHLVSWEKENVCGEGLKASRIACNEYMTKFAGKDAFLLRVRVHPIHVLRINNILSCDGADNSRLVREEHPVNPWAPVPELASVKSYYLSVVRVQPCSGGPSSFQVQVLWMLKDRWEQEAV